MSWSVYEEPLRRGSAPACSDCACYDCKDRDRCKDGGCSGCASETGHGAEAVFFPLKLCPLVEVRCPKCDQMVARYLTEMTHDRLVCLDCYEVVQKRIG